MAKKQKPELPRPNVYLVWALVNTNSNNLSNLGLRAVYTEDQHRFAKIAIETLKHERHVIRAWIEKRECNHFFGQSMICPIGGEDVVVRKEGDNENLRWQYS